MAESKAAISKIQELLLFAKAEANLPPPTQPNVVVCFKDATFSWDQAESSMIFGRSIKNFLEAATSNGASLEREPFQQESKLDEGECLVKLSLSIEKVISLHIDGNRFFRKSWLE